MKVLTKLIAALLALTFVVASCGSDDDEAGTTEAPTTTVHSGDDMTDEMTDEGPGTIVDVASSNEAFSTLVAAVIQAELAETLSSEGPFTVLAPTNDAFEAALAELGITAEELLADPGLGDILTYHVLPGAVAAADVVTLDGQEVETVNGASVTIGVDGDAVTVNGINVVTPDIMASNGIIHVIDGVLLPPS